ncbi:hypothetical protein BGZ80_006187 [Entomortierella chlamydospora]|uniref:Ran guanine nucleotide release factor n=1 Tax=Entomortierella chlamydospora TaxID=101097 RepID=A0A9P6MZ33_9FUNG|nr:hypothetical protein BGZ80_006187 [Entomortierella chlamydospora]
MDTVQQELFGGAITLNLPRKFENISHVREVPDHQEVFVNVEEDQSVIVEILELATQANDEGCAAAEAKIYLLLGQQRIAKFNERQRQVEDAAAHPNQQPHADARNLVQIMMVVVRLPRQETDVVISYNVPLQISESSSSKQVAHEGNIQEAEVWFRNMIGSFLVRDWSLFGPGH